ncbi:MAG TPA: hypothetical protein VN240_04005 [Propylenella sp.]|nr:hypothetical protein [Propylenella sp.]
MARILGTSVAEFLIGNGEYDWLFALGGNDQIQSGPGRDVLCGGAGHDFAVYSDLNGPVWVNLTGGYARSLAQDVFRSIESAIGTSFKDVMIGSNATNVLSGADGADQLFASLGDDVVQGGRGDDYLKGGRGFGDDVLDGGEGDDFITSGWWSGETDTIVFASGGGEDVVEFFNVESDQLALEGLFAEQLVTTDYDAGTLVQAATGESIFLIGVHDIGVADLILV